MASSQQQKPSQLAPDNPDLGASRTPSPLREVKHLSTEAAYELWAPHYDTDGNFLQALDTMVLREMLPGFLRGVASDGKQGEHGREDGEVLTIVDLGCGTGRNTLQIVTLAPEYGIGKVVGLDFSNAMLEVARKRLKETLNQMSPTRQVAVIPKVELFQFDVLASGSLETRIPAAAKGADAVISTLVLEHVPLEPYFKTCSEMLQRPGTKLLVTNMHAEMGKVSQAGFVDPKTGAKIRGESFAHEVEDVVKAASREGWRVEGEVKELGVDTEEMVMALGKRSRKWFETGVKTWFGMIFVREKT